MGPGLMLLQVASGVGATSAPSLTSGFSTHMHLLADSPFPPAIGNMKTSKNVLTSREFVKPSMGHLPLSSCHLLEVWEELQTYATKDSPLYSSTIAWIRCRLSFSLLRSSSEVLVLPLAVLPDSRFHLLILCLQRLESAITCNLLTL